MSVPVATTGARLAGLQGAVAMRFGAFGDMVMLLPMLRYLAQRHGAPVDVVSSGGWTRPLLGSQPYVGELCLVSSRNAPYWLNRSQREMVRWLSQRRNGALYICQTDAKARRFGSRSGWADGQIYWAENDPFEEGEHWIERWLRIAHQCHGEVFERAAVQAFLREGWLSVTEGAQEDCARWIRERGWEGRPLVLLQAGNKRTMRRGSVERSSNVKFWPDECWAGLCREMLRLHPELQILFCGSPEEHDYAQRLVSAVADERVCSVADQLPIPRLLALQQCAHSMVSVDTGPAHSAAALDCPLVVLFGQMDPSRWRPYAVNSPVVALRAPSEQIRHIPQGEVIEAWASLGPRGGIESAGAAE